MRYGKKFWKTQIKVLVCRNRPNFVVNVPANIMLPVNEGREILIGNGKMKLIELVNIIVISKEYVNDIIQEFLEM